MGCACGSHRLGKTRSIELTKNFEEKLVELDVVCEDLNNLYQRYALLKARYDEIIGYWKQQRRRGLIATEEYQELAEHFESARPRKIKEDN